MGTVGGNICQEPRCWYYRHPDNTFDCTRKGGRYCNAFTGDNRFHSIFGSMKVGTRPCTAACPGAVDIPEYMERLRAGDVDGAARLLLERNPLPAVTGRVCPHTCEDDCNRGLFDEAVSVRAVERHLGDSRPGARRSCSVRPPASRQVGRRRGLRARPVSRPPSTCGCAVTGSPSSSGQPSPAACCATPSPRTVSRRTCCGG